MKITVVIPVYNNHEDLHRCIDSVLQNTRRPDEIFVIDNGSEPPIELIKDTHKKNVTLLDESKIGSYAARNKGIRHSTGSIIGFTDSDCIVDKYWIENAYDLLINNPEVGFISGKICVFPIDRNKPNIIERYDMFFSFNQYKCLKYANFSATANMWSTRKMFLTYGLFNESLLSTGDYEWGNRITKNGFKGLYSETVIVYHPARNMLAQLKIRNMRVGAGFCDQSDKAIDTARNFYRLILIGKHRIKDIYNCKYNMKLKDKISIIFIIIFERIYCLIGFISRLLLSRQYR